MMLQSGELTSPEFLTGTDQIKREFNIRMNDMSGYYKEATDRSSKEQDGRFKNWYHVHEHHGQYHYHEPRDCQSDRNGTWYQV